MTSAPASVVFQLSTELDISHPPREFFVHFSCHMMRSLVRLKQDFSPLHMLCPKHGGFSPSALVEDWFWPLISWLAFLFHHWLSFVIVYFLAPLLWYFLPQLFVYELSFGFLYQKISQSVVCGCKQAHRTPNTFACSEERSSLRFGLNITYLQSPCCLSVVCRQQL